MVNKHGNMFKEKPLLNQIGGEKDLISGHQQGFWFWEKRRGLHETLGAIKYSSSWTFFEALLHKKPVEMWTPFISAITFDKSCFLILVKSIYLWNKREEQHFGTWKHSRT